MEIIRLEKVDSTQKYLKELIAKDGYTKPLCINAQEQFSGVGSRGNSWIGQKGNLFFSFVLNKEALPDDLPIQSASIYFSFLLKKLLSKFGSKVFLKWPNDFYIDNRKIGGVITSTTKDLLYCGIGLNIVEINNDYGKLDIQINTDILLEEYFMNLDKKILWKQIFSEFKIEFMHSKKFQVNIDGIKVSLEDAILNSDGSIQIENKKVFSLR